MNETTSSNRDRTEFLVGVALLIIIGVVLHQVYTMKTEFQGMRNKVISTTDAITELNTRLKGVEIQEMTKSLAVLKVTSDSLIKDYGELNSKVNIVQVPLQDLISKLSNLKTSVDDLYVNPQKGSRKKGRLQALEDELNALYQVKVQGVDNVPEGQLVVFSAGLQKARQDFVDAEKVFVDLTDQVRGLYREDKAGNAEGQLANLAKQLSPLSEKLKEAKKEFDALYRIESNTPKGQLVELTNQVRELYREDKAGNAEGQLVNLGKQLEPLADKIKPLYEKANGGTESGKLKDLQDKIGELLRPGAAPSAGAPGTKTVSLLDLIAQLQSIKEATDRLTSNQQGPLKNNLETLLSCQTFKCSSP
jgi:uncharacterized coiled-coil DUF342 family protein